MHLDTERGAQWHALKEGIRQLFNAAAGGALLYGIFDAIARIASAEGGSPIRKFVADSAQAIPLVAIPIVLVMVPVTSALGGGADRSCWVRAIRWPVSRLLDAPAGVFCGATGVMLMLLYKDHQLVDPIVGGISSLAQWWVSIAIFAILGWSGHAYSVLLTARYPKNRNVQEDYGVKVAWFMMAVLVILGVFQHVQK